ncbi:MAG: Rrf2 family transcriptional regulator [Planctomycetota bacterium]
MMLSQTAEYALRAVASLAASGDRLVPTAELAKAADVPMPYLAKVLQQLAAADLIKGRRGVGGGYMLNRSHEEISLFDIINAVNAVRVPGENAQADDAAETDPVLGSLERVVREATTSAISVYQTVTIADLSCQQQRMSSAQVAEQVTQPAVAAR